MAIMTSTRTLAILERYSQVRAFTERLAAPLSPEDCAIQSMADVSPTRWHLAHTTWFFETFVLSETSGYRPFHPAFEYLFNSYYNAVGEQFPRAKRGLISRPGLEETLEYRQRVDEAMRDLLAEGLSPDLARVVELGLHHEQQHQELILTDIKHVLSCNPTLPAYQKQQDETSAAEAPLLDWRTFDEGLFEVGHEGKGFAYDNESPRHRVFLERFALANRLVTCGEWLAFMEDGGYQRPEFWLSLGWGVVKEQGWLAPLYWTERGDEWRQFTLSGDRAIDPNEPVCHVSYFEADAFARWSNARLPTEAEWEHAARETAIAGNFADSGRFHPAIAKGEENVLSQLFGDVWEWTASPYIAYSGYRAPAGALGEYNGKFMCNQYVLRGGSCATSRSHIRATYRNFFPPDARWQFSGVRLARDA